MADFRKAFENVDPEALNDMLEADVAFYSPILTKAVNGRDLVVQILGTAVMGFGVPTNIGEYGEGSKRVVTWDGVMDGHPLNGAFLITESPAGKVQEIVVHMRPWPVVALFREHMMKTFYGEIIPAPYWELQPQPQ